MKAKEILATLEALGSAQTRKIYRRHGVGDNQYGVSYADLNKLKKKIRVDHAAAQQLWATGNHDARVLAAMIADPKLGDEPLLDAWAAGLDNYVVTDAFAGFAGKTAFARRKMEEWTGSDEEWKGQAGWLLLAHLAMHDETMPDAFFEPYLASIEREIHTRKNRVRYAMNSALIAIGSRSDALEEEALAVARKTGKVEVDHGDTGCRTPDAATYIRKARARQEARGGKR